MNGRRATDSNSGHEQKARDDVIISPNPSSNYPTDEQKLEFSKNRALVGVLWDRKMFVLQNICISMDAALVSAAQPRPGFFHHHLLCEYEPASENLRCVMTAS